MTLDVSIYMLLLEAKIAKEKISMIYSGITLIADENSTFESLLSFYNKQEFFTDTLDSIPSDLDITKKIDDTTG
jgi:hypothetical protein